MLHYKNELKINLEAERKNNAGKVSGFDPKPHQLKALSRLSDFYKESGKRGILVIPTGGGKTYTAVYWLLKHVVPNHSRILWLADQGFLLEQAYETFRSNILSIPHGKRTTFQMRLVSGSPRHADANSISVNDDVLFLTSQTAISQWEAKDLDDNGKTIKTKFQTFLEESAKDARLFIVYDEAHHTAAFGRRNLLVGGSVGKVGILERFPNTSLLGMTATPTHSDPHQRGWLSKIFGGEPIFRVEKKELENAGILALADYQPEKTNFHFEISDAEVERVIVSHQELPTHIIDSIAKNEDRNNYLAEYYLKNREKLGKTIIFVDRWYQCRTIENKINQKAGKRIAASVFSYVDKNSSADYVNARTSDENERLLEEFRQNQIEVLINVRMLTEGVDVPDVKSVFITRETNSTILFTQMVGRALRGPASGGKKDRANIILFTDNWSHHVQFAGTSMSGGTEDKKVERGYRPFELISINLIDSIQFNLEQQNYETAMKDFIPVGWFSVEYDDTLIEEIDDQIEKSPQTFSENVLVYEGELEGFERLAEDFLSRDIDEIWEKEEVNREEVTQLAAAWGAKYFPPGKEISEAVKLRLTQIGRHLGQKRVKPEFYKFEQRETLNLRPHVEKTYRGYDRAAEMEYLEAYYHLPENNLLRVVFVDFDGFLTAFEYERRAFEKEQKGKASIAVSDQKIKSKRLAPEEVRRRVLSRDDHRCLCCGKATGLNIDHIVAHKHEEPDDDNPEFYQTLCNVCNREKSANGFNYRATNYAADKIQLRPVKKASDSEPAEYFLRRLVNCYYGTKAVQREFVEAKNNGNSIWRVNVYHGAGVDKTFTPFKKQIIEYIKISGYQLRDLVVTEN